MILRGIGRYNERAMTRELSFECGNGGFVSVFRLYSGRVSCLVTRQLYPLSFFLKPWHIPHSSLFPDLVAQPQLAVPERVSCSLLFEPNETAKSDTITWYKRRSHKAR